MANQRKDLTSDKELCVAYVLRSPQLQQYHPQYQQNMIKPNSVSSLPAFRYNRKIMKLMK